MVVNDALIEAKKILKENNIDEREARLILAFSLKISKEELIIKNEITADEYLKFINTINRRASGIPYAYIVGYKEFMKLRFIVNENVLIPRADTEVLVYEAIKLNKKSILDLCTGSGAIAISLAKNINSSKVLASDISEKALEVARLNAKNNNVDIKFVKSDLFKGIKGKFDLIVSNPPYIKTKEIENLQKEVKNEPSIALDGGIDGLDFYRIIINESRNYLNENGILMFEIGYDQAKDVSNLLLTAGFKEIKIIKDLSENDRVIYGTY